MLLRALTRSDTFTLADLPGFPAWAQSLTGPVAVTDETTLALPAANRCVAIISDTIASLELHEHVDGLRSDDTPPPLLRQPEPDRTRVESVATMVVSLLMHGNAYALVADRDWQGYPTKVVVTNPAAVTVRQEPNGTVVYGIGGRTFDSSELIHVRGMTLPGQHKGVGVVELHRRALALSTAAEDYSGQLWTTGGAVDGFLHTDHDMTATEADDIASRWVQKHGGRQRSVPVLSGGLKFQQVAWSNVDLEALESRKWNSQMVCQMFGVPPIFAHVPSSESRTYQNVTQDTRAFALYTLRPWLTRLEAALSAQRPRGRQVRFDLDDLLRADRLERYQAHKLGVDGGWLDINDVRAAENMPPVADPVPAVPDVPEEEAPADE